MVKKGIENSTKVQEIVNEKIKFFFGQSFIKEKYSNGIEIEKEKQKFEALIKEELKDKYFQKIIKEAQWETLGGEIINTLFGHTDGSYDEDKLMKLIDERIDYLIANSEAKFELFLDSSKRDEEKKELINKVWDRWTSYDLEQIKAGLRSHFDYSNFSVIEKEIDEIICMAEPRIKREINVNNKSDSVRMKIRVLIEGISSNLKTMKKRGKKTYLQNELQKLIDEYKDGKPKYTSKNIPTYRSMRHKDFIELYIFSDLRNHGYKDFDSFYHNIFEK